MSFGRYLKWNVFLSGVGDLGIQDLTVFCCDFTLQEAHSLQNGGERSPSVLF